MQRGLFYIYILKLINSHWSCILGYLYEHVLMSVKASVIDLQYNYLLATTDVIAVNTKYHTQIIIITKNN